MTARAWHTKTSRARDVAIRHGLGLMRRMCMISFRCLIALGAPLVQLRRCTLCFSMTSVLLPGIYIQLLAEPTCSQLDVFVPIHTVSSSGSHFDTLNMASVLATATKAAHSAATSLLSAAEVKVGSTIPIKVPIKEEAPDKPFTLEGISGKNVFVRYVLACHFARALHH